MAKERLRVEWDAITVGWATTMNANGGINGQPANPMKVHPYRKHEPKRHDISILKKLLEVPGNGTGR